MTFGEPSRMKTTPLNPQCLPNGGMQSPPNLLILSYSSFVTQHFFFMPTHSNHSKLLIVPCAVSYYFTPLSPSTCLFFNLALRESPSAWKEHLGF